MPLLVLALLLVVTPPDDTASVVAAALLRVKQADAREPTLTRFQLEHNLILKSNGQRSGESTKLYEQTWINGLPYKMLIERNGKPSQERSSPRSRSVTTSLLPSTKPSMKPNVLASTMENS